MRDSIKSIQFLRFVAASLVVFSHSALAIDGYFKGITSKSVLYIANFGASGVHIFFVISGFIMVYTSFGRGFRKFEPARFYFRRFCRIYPIYWVYAGGYLILHEYVLVKYDISISTILGSLLLLPGYSPLIIGPGWTLSFEVYFYICFGMFMILGLARGLTVMTFCFVAAIAIGFAFNTDNAVFHLVTDSLLLEFLAGAWIGYLFITGVRVGSTRSNILLGLAVAGYLGGLMYGYHRLPSILMWGIPSALLIAGLVFKERTGHLASFIERLSFLGDSSYSLYLLHILLVDLLLSFYSAVFPEPSLGYVELCSALTVLCIIMAFILYELIERRIVVSLQAKAKIIFGPNLINRAI